MRSVQRQMGRLFFLLLVISLSLICILEQHLELLEAELTIPVGVQLAHQPRHLVLGQLLGQLAQVLGRDVALLVPVQGTEGQLSSCHDVSLEKILIEENCQF